MPLPPVLPLLALGADEANWDLLRQEVPDLDGATTTSLREALSARVTAVVIERHYIDKDYRDAFSHYYSKRFATLSSRCVRLHFFSRLPREDLTSLLSAVWGGEGSGPQALLQAAYLGYSVIRPTRQVPLGRTLLVPECRDGMGSCHLALCEERISLLGCRLTITGFPFVRQDLEVAVCAQAALWMVHRYYSNRYSCYQETLPYELAALAEGYTLGRAFPTAGGLYLWQMAEILRRLGFTPLCYSKAQLNNNPGAQGQQDQQVLGMDGQEFFAHLLYTYIESGVPLIVATKNHVLPAFGHYSDYETAASTYPPRRFSSSLNRGFIVNDDNHFPYLRLPVQPSGEPNDHPTLTLDQVTDFIVPLAERIVLPAGDFCVLLAELLWAGAAPALPNRHEWEDAVATFRLDHASPALKDQMIVLRPFLTSCKNFKNELNQRGMGHPKVRQQYRELPLPHFIWVCEIGLADEYGKLDHCCRGEVLWDATVSRTERMGFLAVHYPDFFVFNQAATLENRPARSHQDFVSIPASELPSSTFRPYPLSRTNLASTARTEPKPTAP